LRRLLFAATILAAVGLQFAAPVLAQGAQPEFAPEPPFVICQHQRYALCAEASCFVYDTVAYCQCDIMHGDSISLELSYTSAAGERNVCDVNRQGRRNGYMVSTFSFPINVEKGGPAAVYTCPGSANAGNGVSAPVAYGQCDGAICSTSSRGQRFPGFAGKLKHNENICSCPISTDATPGSSDVAGFQIFGPYHPDSPAGSRCDPNGCAPCSVPNPTANGSTIPVGAPSGTADFLTLKLDGPPLPDINQCLCTCTKSPAPAGSITCTIGSDITPQP
jgi:hypothetical protein